MDKTYLEYFYFASEIQGKYDNNAILYEQERDLNRTTKIIEENLTYKNHQWIFSHPEFIIIQESDSSISQISNNTFQKTTINLPIKIDKIISISSSV